MTATTPAAPANIPDFYSSIIAWGRHELRTIEGQAVTLWDTIEPALITEAESLVARFLGTAIAAVKTQAQLVLSNQEKFSNAKDAVLQAIEASGGSVGNTLLEFLVNLALSLLKVSTSASLI